MKNKQSLKNFYLKSKRVLFTSLCCIMAIAVICLIAVKTSGAISREYKDESVNTSTKTEITFIMPVENGEIIKDFSNTSLKYNATLKQWESHKAVDIKGDDDSKVMACYDGEVVSIKTTYLNGTVITIKHNDDLQTVYGSLDENVLINVGDKVVQGQEIGVVSSSAKNESADGNHLHFEVLLNGIKVDPNLYLTTQEK